MSGKYKALEIRIKSKSNEIIEIIDDSPLTVSEKYINFASTVSPTDINNNTNKSIQLNNNNNNSPSTPYNDAISHELFHTKSCSYESQVYQFDVSRYHHPTFQQQQQQQQQQLSQNYAMSSSTHNYYPNQNNNNNNNIHIQCDQLVPSIMPSSYTNPSVPNFSVGRLHRNTTELMSRTHHTNKPIGNRIDRTGNRNVKHFSYKSTNNGEQEFLRKYAFTDIDSINGESNLYIDMAGYNELRGEFLTEFNRMCEGTFSIDVNSERSPVKLERLRFQKRICKDKNKDRWESCKKRFNKSSKTEPKTDSEATRQTQPDPQTPISQILPPLTSPTSILSPGIFNFGKSVEEYLNFMTPDTFFSIDEEY